MGVGSVLAFFLAEGFTVEVEGSVTGEGCRAVNVDGGSYTSAFHKLTVSQIEGSNRTCAAAEDGITVGKSRTTVFFRFLVFEGSVCGGSSAPTGSADASACRSEESAGVESL